MVPTVALSPCVSQVLQTLSIAALSALCDVIDLQRDLLATEKAKRQLQTVVYDAVSLAAETQYGLLNTVLAPIKEGLQAYPSNFARAVPNCPELGTILQSPQDILSGLLAISDGLAFRTREVTALAANVTDRINQLTELDTLLAATCTLITNLIVAKTSPPAAA